MSATTRADQLRELSVDARSKYEHIVLRASADALEAKDREIAELKAENARLKDTIKARDIDDRLADYSRRNSRTTNEGR